MRAQRYLCQDCGGQAFQLPTDEVTGIVIGRYKLLKRLSGLSGRPERQVIWEGNSIANV